MKVFLTLLIFLLDFMCFLFAYGACHKSNSVYDCSYIHDGIATLTT